jgi:hypothetical protein
MKTFLKSSLLLSAVLLIAACGKKLEPLPADATLLDATVLNAGSLRTDGSTLSGTGSVVLNQPLSGTASGQSYALAFRLEDGGSLTLQSNASNRLQNGIALHFQRNGAALSVKLIAGGAENDVSNAFATLDVTGELQLQIDVHNNEVPAHILVWSGADFSEGAALLNSEEAGREAPGNGAGQYWGLELSQASVTRAAVSEPKFEE